jgi:ACS family hexuronate transporter-like MFS transporter
MTHFRWAMVVLLFFATVLNYADRAVLGILKPHLGNELGWSQIDYSNIVTTFQLLYAAGYLFSGRLLDVITLRLGYALSVGLWSLAAMGHAAMRSIAGFCIARGALGLAEGGNFPAAIKTVTEWFPKRERALATGLFNAGSNIGAIICPLAVPWLTVRWGWQSAFLTTGAAGFVWVLAWALIYRVPERHPRVSPAELALIRSEPPDPQVKIPWLELLRHKQTWAFVIGFACSAPVWWFYINWIPDFLNKQYSLNLTQTSLPLVAIYLVADVGGIAGGWLSSSLIRRGWSVNAARKTALSLCAVCVVPVFFTPLTDHLWLSIWLVALAAAAHCGFAANLFTLVSDTVPRQAVSSVVGIGGMAGSLGGIVFMQLIGYVLQYTNNNYLIPFAISSLIYLAAVAAMHGLLPRLEPMELHAVTITKD